MSDERGVILFDCRWDQSPPLPASPQLDAVVEWRNRLADRGLVGVDQNGIGFGNVSARARAGSPEFVITGSQTGHIPDLTGAHISLVTGFDLTTNCLFCLGPVKASSESLTHGTLYRLRDFIGGVVHVHHGGLWKAHIHRYPTTNEKVEAGTPQMAAEIESAMQSLTHPGTGLVVMAGHEHGLLAFGPDVGSCGALLLKLLEELAVDQAGQ